MDVGGTNTAIGVVDVEGNVMFKDNIPTATHGDFEKFIEELSEAVKSLIISAKLLNENLEILGIGIGAPTGIITTAPLSMPRTSHSGACFIS